MKLILRYKWLRTAYFCMTLIIGNILIIYFFDIQVSRMARWLSTLLFLLFFYHHGGLRNRLIFFVFILFLLKDGLIINYEDSFHKTLAFIISNLAYVLLSLIPIKKVKIIAKNPVLIVFAIAMIGLNAFNIYYLSDVIFESLDNQLQLGLFFLQGVLLIFLGLIAFAYNDRYDGDTPLLFLYFSFCLILCDLSGLGSYFFKWEIAYFPERIFYLLSLALLVTFTITKNEERQERLIFLAKKEL